MELHWIATLMFFPSNREVEADLVGILTRYFCWHIDGYELPAGPALIKSGQIIATSHDLTPNGGLVREFPLFQGNLAW